MTIEWGGSGIEQVVYGFILGRINPTETIVEFGAGDVSTLVLRTYYNLYSVEHNEEFCGKYDGVNYIYAPIKDGWYDIDVLKKQLPKNPSLVLIDGCNRLKHLEHLDLLSKETLYIIHDTYRDAEIELTQELAKWKGVEPRFITECDYFGIV